MSIEVKSEVLRHSEDEVRKLSKRLGSIESSLQSIRKSLDSDIKNSGNIDKYFKNICEEMDQNEKNLANVAKFLSNTAKIYEDAEKKIKKDLNGISQKKSARNLISKLFDKISSIKEKIQAILTILGLLKILRSPIGPIIILSGLKRYFDEKGIALNNKIEEIEIKKADIPELKEVLTYDPNTYKEEVLLLQRRLNELERDEKYKIKEDGLFGKETLEAVNRYKEKHGLWNFGEYEGKVGKTTWEHLFTNGQKYDVIEKAPVATENIIQKDTGFDGKDSVSVIEKRGESDIASSPDLISNKDIGILNNSILNFDKTIDNVNFNITKDMCYENNDMIKLCNAIKVKGISLRKGSKGKDVESLQRMLVRIGLLQKENITGVYDEETYKAVVRLQELTGEETDGIFGLKTYRKLGNIIFDEYIQKEYTGESKFETVQGNFWPHYYQGNNSEWSNNKFSILDDARCKALKQFMSQSACSVTSAAMVISNLTGETVTPDIIAKYAILTGYRKYDGGVDHEFFEAVGEEFGLKVKSYGSANRKKIIEALKNGEKLVVNVGPEGDFTNYGHYLVFGDIREKDGVLQVLVIDPVAGYNEERVDRTAWHSLDYMLDKYGGCARSFYSYKK